jgi:hypothetical protein
MLDRLYSCLTCMNGCSCWSPPEGNTAPGCRCKRHALPLRHPPVITSHNSVLTLRSPAAPSVAPPHGRQPALTDHGPPVCGSGSRWRRGPYTAPPNTLHRAASTASGRIHSRQAGPNLTRSAACWCVSRRLLGARLRRRGWVGLQGEREQEWRIAGEGSGAAAGRRLGRSTRIRSRWHGGRPSPPPSL